jgi:hypothetical protein
VSELHCEPSQPVLPNLTADVSLVIPIPCPNTVTLNDPVKMAFPRPNTLTELISEVKTIVEVPDRNPEVSDTERLLLNPSATLH